MVFWLTALQYLFHRLIWEPLSLETLHSPHPVIFLTPSPDKMAPRTASPSSGSLPPRGRYSSVRTFQPVVARFPGRWWSPLTNRLCSLSFSSQDTHNFSITFRNVHHRRLNDPGDRIPMGRFQGSGGAKRAQKCPSFFQGSKKRVKFTVLSAMSLPTQSSSPSRKSRDDDHAILFR